MLLPRFHPELAKMPSFFKCCREEAGIIKDYCENRGISVYIKSDILHIWHMVFVNISDSELEELKHLPKENNLRFQGCFFDDYDWREYLYKDEPRTLVCHFIGKLEKGVDHLLLFTSDGSPLTEEEKEKFLSAKSMTEVLPKNYTLDRRIAIEKEYEDSDSIKAKINLR